MMVECFRNVLFYNFTCISRNLWILSTYNENIRVCFDGLTTSQYLVAMLKRYCMNNCNAIYFFSAESTFSGILQLR